ncbi:MAG: undecaprenyldiphospho-muramoylpentapeptide beta-N-acetylglucosaminyltransferase [Flavobacteriaceae bacterium]|nr:MAG: undecaprenyldiphospho-muramoylpentapeptide beta-N-acetylglucosaminyltransferase [Flavobacteriaceae bacterium]
MKQSSKTSPRIILSGGGTGGHIFPAVAIADQLKKEFPSCEILFVGANGKMEMEKVPKAGYSIKGVDISGIDRSSIKNNLGFPLKLIKSLSQARKIISDFKPDFAIGTGGYASGPTLLMCALKGIPYLIQEQNSIPGLTNKLLGKRAKAIAVAYPNMEAFFNKNKIHFTGNPIRTEIFDNYPNQEVSKKKFGLYPNKTTVLSVGGSLGSQNINKAWEKSVLELLDQDIQFIWQTGKTDYKRLKELPFADHPGLILSEFIYNMDDAYAAADVIISRAGAIAISELCMAQKPVILIPLPWAAEDHQTKNAESLENHKAAIIVKDKDAEQSLVQKTLELCQNMELREEMSQNIGLLKKPDATHKIVRIIAEYL